MANKNIFFPIYQDNGFNIFKLCIECNELIEILFE